MNKNNSQIVLVILTCLVILTIAAVRISQIERNHQANLVLAEACIDKGGTVVITQSGFFALSNITCEE